jgi:hypothetical protein
MAQSTLTEHPKQEYKHLGESRGCENHDHDVIHELIRRLDSIWRYDQYISNADELAELQSFWQSIKQQEHDNIEKLKGFIKKHIEKNCF